ncbi:flagellar hook protein [Salinivibrio sp. AR647]|uniref:flagellar filament capping protein FliD n=1 Tax=Salinivibrio sp. AR647 TaxID=1909438 RepID=UPI000984E11A|nr:flagellar filament capping protein FliD [Salinivibrio sp. AR647]OOE93250.1 flagellar hook protein [Salinivibrio sp. AR647]
MSVKAAGMGGGMDINAMVTKIVDAERAPKQERIIKRTNDVETDISAFGRLKDSLATLKTQMYDFRRNEGFSARTTSVSNPDALGATATPDAIPGRYQVDVQQLAGAHKLVSPGVDPDASLGTGKLTITMGNRTSVIDVPQGKDSLADVVRAINNDPKNPGIQASLIQDDSGTRMVLNGNKTGETNRIEVNVDAQIGSALHQLGFQAGQANNGMTQMQAAQDAKILIDGIASVSSTTNTFDNAIEGVSLEVDQTSDKPLSLAVEHDRESVRSTITSFVDNYNAFFRVSQAVSQYDPETQQGGPLAGESVIRTATSRLRNLFSSPIEKAPEGMKTLSELGVTTTMDGRLEIDNKVLDRQLRQNFNALEGFFGGNDGFARQLEQVINGFTGAGGAISNRESTLSEQKLRLRDDQRELDRRMESLESRTMQRFSAMEEATSQMRSQLQAMQNIMPG